VIVAATLDASSERIVGYLNERGVAINVLFFQVFNHGDGQLLSRAWLIDPGRRPDPGRDTTVRGEKEPWNGEFYVSFGAGPSRAWDEASAIRLHLRRRRHVVQQLAPHAVEGDRVWVKIPGKGFVGVGRVRGPRVAARDFEIEGRPALDILQAEYHRADADDPERSEYFVPVEWLHTVPEAEAVQELGMFGNQNTVCKPVTPRWRAAVDQLKARFRVG
jgi:hypothetical protein